ncbi:MAG: hypothetical protein HN742_31825 [Lentisphaerae bacterium]|jgi:hypothetical protein|nr:hypothetical protein [Lentisphaerota bacterium]MBT4815523.1 hypothetical protein [Lentisphaerota bacterium]MBT5606503.1 hypothetical protein [Lentisphaerota bacterium]MBT7062301.1 hypothetical protein [Lentisphaerota bacterium]MBT7846502.1 hypothetical protein [Lentisphaerota bacterium]
MRLWRVFCAGCLGWAFAHLFVCRSQAQPAPAMTIENDHIKLLVGRDGQILQVIDRESGAELCAKPGGTPFARVTKGGKETGSTGASLVDGVLDLEFGEATVSAKLKVTPRGSHFLFEVTSVSDKAVDRLTFLDLPLSLKGTPEESVAGCVLALNLQTQVHGIPAATSRLRAACYPRFGFAGAKAAVIICPQGELRSVMQEVVSAAEDLPHSPIGGPWALDGKDNNGSYLFNTSDLSEETVDEWIALAQTLGITQIDFHGGTSFRFGDCRPNPTTYPRGAASMKAVLDKLHGAGILAGLHTYAMFIDKSCPWVTPVPDPRLGTDATFTLRAALNAEMTDVPVEETTATMSTITGFFVRNSVTLRIGDELITYAGLSKKQPYAFTQCKRGAYGTAVSAHEKSAKVYHLRECFGRFVPDGDSTLFTEVAAKTAELYNAAGFDMIYLDALDGGDAVAGRENAWHYQSKFTFAICERIERPAIMEMSTFHHHLWYVRSRMGAWDHPTRSHKKFIDIHGQANQRLHRQFLPGHLGWWAFKTWHGLDSEPTYEDDIEYLCTKALASNTGLSIMGITPANVGKIPALPRLASIVRRHESLRHAGYFSEEIKQKLRVPGDEYALFQGDDGDWQFRPEEHDRHKVESREAWSSTWTVENSFDSQPPALRIEVLTAARPYDSSDGKVLADLGEVGVLPQVAAQPGIAATLEPSTAQVRTGTVSGCFSATNSTPTAIRSWSKMGKTFSPPLDLSGNRALGLWVYGDGKGEVINLQQTSPSHLSHGIADHYILVDFVGWRYLELIEPEGARHADYSWPYGGIYSIYRESIRPNAVQTLSLWYNNLPPGEQATCYLSPIQALPTVEATLRNPRVSIGGATLTFPVEIKTGQVLEFRSPTDCRLFGRQGEDLARVTPLGDVPTLAAGANLVRFECDETDGLNPRAYVSVITRGAPVRGKAPDDQIGWDLLRREDDPPHTIRALDGKQNRWETICRPNPPQATLEVEIAVDAIGEPGALYGHPDALTLISSDSLEAFADTAQNEYAKYVVSGPRRGFPKSLGVTHDLALADGVVREGKSTLRYQATSTQDGGWSARGKRFDPPLDLAGYTHVGFPIHGDGNGEVLYLQLRDTKGAWHDMKVGVGFTGWKYREFPLAGAACDLASIEYLIVYYNALPKGKTCVCCLADVRALRDPRALRDATLVVGADRLVFPGMLQPGERLVYRTHDDCVIYGGDGKQKARVLPKGKSPSLAAGRNQVRFEFAGDVSQPLRARVKIVKVYGP